jgi:hypothetical protein
MSHERENLNTPLENSAVRPDVGTALVPEMHSNNAYLMAEDHIVCNIWVSKKGKV